MDKTTTNTYATDIQTLIKFTSDDLTFICRTLDAINYLLSEMQIDFFERYDFGKKQRPEQEQEQVDFLLWEFPRYRAKANAIELLLHSIGEELRALKASCYSDDYL